MKGEFIIALVTLGYGLIVLLLGYIRALGQGEAVIICAVAAIGSIFFSPLLGLCLLSSTFVLGSLPALGFMDNYTTLSKAIAGVTAVSFFFRSSIRQDLAQTLKRSFRADCMRWYSALGLWPVVLIPFALAESDDQFWAFSSQVAMVGMVFLLGAIPENIQELEIILVVTCFGTAILAAFTIVYGLPASQENLADLTQAANLGAYRNYLGHILATVLILSMIPLSSSRKWVQSLLVIADIILCFGIYLTFSRSTWLGLLTCILLPAALVPKLRFHHRIVYVCTAAFVIATSMLLLGSETSGDPDMWNRFWERAYSATDSTRSADRMEFVWPMSIEFIKDNWLIGGGVGAQRSLNFSAHNIFLQVAIENGVIGLFFLGLFLVTTTMEALRNIQPFLRLCSISILCFWMVAGQFGNPLFNYGFAFSLGVLACMSNLGLCPRKS